MAADEDGDYHIQLGERPDSQERWFIMEVPRPEPAFVADGALHPVFETVRAFVRDKLLRGKEPSGKGSVMTNKPYVRVKGVPFFGDWHIGTDPRRKRACKSPTPWAIHPTTEIGFSAKAE